MSIQIKEQVALAPLTTMRIGGNARFFARMETLDDLKEAVLFARERELPVFILGGGSNTLVSDEGFHGLVVKIEMKGITYDGATIIAGAGETWDVVVRGAVAHNLWGIENLSFIPGTVGGAVVQNIGAYGVEARDVIFSVEAFDRVTMQSRTFLGDECEFGYRESIFKKNKNLVVLRVSFRLAQPSTPRTDYEDVKKYFTEHGVVTPSLLEIREAIVAIRTAKMPPSPLGTVGSFFKNPVASKEQYEALKKQFPEIKAYPQADNTVKLSAAWFIDHVGHWRGVRRGDAGVHEKQALILVNYGTASAEEMLSLAEEIKKDIKEKTGVTLEEEIVLI